MEAAIYAYRLKQPKVILIKCCSTLEDITTTLPDIKILTSIRSIFFLFPTEPEKKTMETTKIEWKLIDFCCEILNFISSISAMWRMNSSLYMKFTKISLGWI